MDERDTHDPLRDLEERLDRARRGREREASGSSPHGGSGIAGGALGLALRFGTELVVAIVVATAIGWALDSWLGTRPWAMIVFFFLGVAAGMMNVWRAVTGMGMAVGYRRPPEERRKDVDGSDDEE